MEKLTLELDSTTELERFKCHLDSKDNKRIVFSAPFGSGKTHFLNEFFEQNKEKYNYIFISPVKYSVLPNRDIFELIKVDIIMQLFVRNYISPEVATKKSAESDSWKDSKTLVNIAGELAKIAPLLDPDMPSSEKAAFKLVEVLPVLKKIYDSVKTKKQKDSHSEEESLIAYLEEQGQVIGTGFEANEITELIRNILERISEGRKKENVLIIDDFDRLDPEHIFRILNVLSVHNDYCGTENKFGFDKIIIVCDVSKLEHMFKHRYGSEADFEGYMDKFYSTHYFWLRLENIIASALYKNIIKYSPLERSQTNQQIVLLSTLLAFFVRHNHMTIRKIVKCTIDFYLPEKILIESKNVSDFKTAPHIDSDRIYLSSSDLPILKTLKVLVSICGDISSLESLLAKSAGLTSEVIQSNLQVHETEAIICSLALGKAVTSYGSLLDVLSTKGNEYRPTDWNPPRIKLLSTSVRLNVFFSKGTKYTGDCSIFSKASLVVENIPKRITYHDVITTLQEIIRGARANGYLQKFDFS